MKGAFQKIKMFDRIGDAKITFAFLRNAVIVVPWLLFNIHFPKVYWIALKRSSNAWKPDREWRSTAVLIHLIHLLLISAKSWTNKSENSPATHIGVRLHYHLSDRKAPKSHAYKLQSMRTINVQNWKWNNNMLFFGSNMAIIVQPENPSAWTESNAYQLWLLTFAKISCSTFV